MEEGRFRINNHLQSTDNINNIRNHQDFISYDKSSQNQKKDDFIPKEDINNIIIRKSHNTIILIPLVLPKKTNNNSQIERNPISNVTNSNINNNFLKDIIDIIKLNKDRFSNFIAENNSNNKKGKDKQTQNINDIYCENIKKKNNQNNQTTFPMKKKK